MIIRELKNEIQEMFTEDIGIRLYAVLKNEVGNIVKAVNIADEDNEQENSSNGLLQGFCDTVSHLLCTYDEGNDIMELSSADERGKAIYYYDLEQFPAEMLMLKNVLDSGNITETFCFAEDTLEQIIAFIIQIGNANHSLILYKQQYPVSLLKRDKYMLTPIPHENRFKKYDKDILRIDFNCQFFLWNDNIYIFDIEKMEKICAFHEVIVNEAKKSIEEIRETGILDNVEVLFDELDNITFARKLTRVYKDSKVLGKVSNKALIEFTRNHAYFSKNPIKVTEDGNKLLLDTKKSKEAFIKLLNDDLLTSQLTNTDYESLAKNNT